MIISNEILNAEAELMQIATHLICRALLLECEIAENNTEAKIPMMATTTSSSRSVNAVSKLKRDVTLRAGIGFIRKWYTELEI